MSAKKSAAAAVLRHFGDDVEEIRDDRGGGEDASMRIADSADYFTLTLQVAMKMEGVISLGVRSKIVERSSVSQSRGRSRQSDSFCPVRRL